MSTEQQLQAPMSPEDEFAAASEAIRAARETQAEPAKPEPAAEAPPASAQGQPRDEAGRFAPRENGAPAAPPEPFEGFSQLPEAVQEQFRGILSRADRAERERNSFRDRFSRANQLAEQLRRQLPTQPASQGSGRQPPQPSQGSGQQAQPGFAQARADVASMPAGAEREAASRQLDAWEAYAKQFPDEAKGIEQLLAKFRDDFASAYTPQSAEIQAIRAELDGLRGVAERFQSVEQQRVNHENQTTMDELAPGWRAVAGWEDANGNPVPREERQWHPAFTAWLDGHDPEIRAWKQQQLGHGSPHVCAEVYREFFADLAAVQGQNQQAPDPVAARRDAALRDVAPTGGRNGGAAPAWRTPQTPEDELEAAMRFATGRQRR